MSLNKLKLDLFVLNSSSVVFKIQFFVSHIWILDGVTERRPFDVS